MGAIYLASGGAFIAPRFIQLGVCPQELLHVIGKERPLVERAFAQRVAPGQAQPFGHLYEAAVGHAGLRPVS